MIVLTFVGDDDDPSYTVVRENFQLGVDTEIMAGDEVLGYYHVSYGLWYSTFTGKYYPSITMEIMEPE